MVDFVEFAHDCYLKLRLITVTVSPLKIFTILFLSNETLSGGLYLSDIDKSNLDESKPDEYSLITIFDIFIISNEAKVTPISITISIKPLPFINSTPPAAHEQAPTN